MSNLTNYALGPLLADWNNAEVPLNGLAMNQWETSASFTSGGTTYPTGIGLKDAGASNPGYSEWWLDGCYQTFSGTFYLDDRTGANPDLQVQLIGDGSLLASSSWLSHRGFPTFSNVNVTGVKVLRINLVGDGWADARCSMPFPPPPRSPARQASIIMTPSPPGRALMAPAAR